MNKQPKKKQQTPQQEQRATRQRQFEVRKNADGSRSISGYFAVFNSMSEDLGFREIIKPGAFTRTLKQNGDIIALVDHKTDKVLARTSTGSLQLREDGHGLAFTIRSLPNTSYANDLVALMEAGDVPGCSFGFSVAPDGDAWSMTDDGQILRTVTDVDLFEGSIVTSWPAYSATSVSLRSAPDAIRIKLAKRKHGIDDSCDCDCDSCLDGDCADCDADDCTDENCIDCPMQDEADDMDDMDERSRRLDAIARRFRA